MADMVKFYKGLLASLPTTGESGALYITSDEGSIYLGTGTGMKRLGDFIQVNSVSNLPATGANASALYYCVNENILCRYDSGNSKWVQINKQKTLAELGGVAQSAYDTKVVALEQADANNATATSDLTAYVGTFTHNTAKTVVEYINAKTDGIATSASLEAIGARVTAAENNIDAIEAAVSNIKDDANIDSFADVVAELAKKQDTGDYATKAEAQAMADGKDSSIVAAKAAADAAQDDVDALESKVGTVTTGKTIVQMIAEAQTAATYDDAAVKERISAIEDDYLKSTDKATLETAIAAAKQAGDDAQADIDAFLAAAEVGDAAIDTLKEIQDYIESDGAAATEMTNKISALGGRLDALEAIDHSAYAKTADVNSSQSAQDTKIDANTRAIATLNGTGDGSVSKKISDAMTGANLSQYAKQTDLDTATADIEVLEADAHTHANKTLLDTYTQTEANLADAVAKKHSHSNATVLDGITATKVSTWDGAEANAKAYTDDTVNSAKTELTSVINTKANSADVYTKSQTYTQAEVNELLTWGEF